MSWVVLAGAVVSVIGLAGIVVSILRVLGARRRGLSDEELKRALAAAMPLNMGAFLLSALGLMMV
ncbi:MAG: hypothetical protein D6801_02715, partial [Alphaproteobacteria bacterium]